MKELVENRAAAAAAYIVGGKARRVDGRSVGDGRRDFDLVYEGRCEPFEVTMAAHEATRATWGRLFRRPPIEADLSRLWDIPVPEYVEDAAGNHVPLDRDRYARELVPVLQALEERGVASFDELALWRDPVVAPFREELAGLSVRYASSLEPPDGVKGGLILAPTGGGVVAPDLIADAVEREQKEDNLGKVGQTEGAHRRHLCVVIDLSAGLTHMAMRHAVADGRVPRVPAVSPPLTTLWAMTEREVLVVTPPGDWDVHVIPDEVREHLERWLVDA